MIFVDTSFWAALAITADTNHRSAVELLEAHHRAPLATSNLVSVETWTLVRRKLGHRQAIALIDRIESARRLTIVRVEEETERDAWEWLRRRNEREYSFVDATSFSLMRRLAIHEALTFDRDVSAAGFVNLAS